MSYADTVNADLRLRLLELLALEAFTTSNEVALQEKLLSAYGHTAFLDDLRAQLNWLDQQDLVVVQRPGGIAVATLTHRGADVARGARLVEGVARPRARG